MSWTLSADKPIFQQLVDIITQDILSGKYKAGERLPAVRELSVLAGVNPNTMQRALTLIEETGLIYTRRGDGRYVGEDDSVIAEVREKYALETAAELVSRLRSLGLADGEIFKTVESYLKSNNEEDNNE